MANYGLYLGSTDAINGSNSAQNLFSIENPISSSVNLIVKQIRVRGILTSDTTTVFSYHCGRTDGLPSGGTVLTAQKQRTSYSDANGIVRLQPIGTLAAGQIWSTTPSIPIIIGAPLTGITAGPEFEEQVFDTINEEENLILAPNEGLMVTVDANATTWRHTIRIYWGESLI